MKASRIFDGLHGLKTSFHQIKADPVEEHMAPERLGTAPTAAFRWPACDLVEFSVQVHEGFHIAGLDSGFRPFEIFFRADR
jgi:hypothetical protein